MSDLLAQFERLSDPTPDRFDAEDDAMLGAMRGAGDARVGSAPRAQPLDGARYAGRRTSRRQLDAFEEQDDDDDDEEQGDADDSDDDDDQDGDDVDDVDEDDDSPIDGFDDNNNNDDDDDDDDR